MGVSWHRDAGPHAGKNPKVSSQCSQKLKPSGLLAPLGMDDEFLEEDKRMSSRDSRRQRGFSWLTDGSHSTQVFLFSSAKGLPLSIPTLKGSVREQVDDLDALEHPVTPVLRRLRQYDSALRQT